MEALKHAAKKAHVLVTCTIAKGSEGEKKIAAHYRNASEEIPGGGPFNASTSFYKKRKGSITGKFKIRASMKGEAKISRGKLKSPSIPGTQSPRFSMFNSDTIKTTGFHKRIEASPN